MPDYLTMRVSGRGLHSYRTATSNRPKVWVRRERIWLKGRNDRPLAPVGVSLVVGHVYASLTWRRWSPNQ